MGGGEAEADSKGEVDYLIGGLLRSAQREMIIHMMKKQAWVKPHVCRGPCDAITIPCDYFEN